jgi:hypothetical protein
LGEINNPARSGNGSGTVSDRLIENAVRKISRNRSGTKTVIALLIPDKIRHIALSKSI